jgi:hypothetical protein
MRAGEFIFEVFEPGKKNWEWRRRSSEEAVADFTVGDRTYQWYAYSHNNISNPTKWEIQFRLIRNQNDPDELDLFGTTGTGNAAEVLSTAVDITRAFLQEYGLDKIEEITFNAKENSRIALYAKMIKRLLPDWDLYQKYSHQNGMEYHLTDRRAYDKPENKISEELTDEMALKQFTPMGDFNKPGPFRGVDKRLVPHPTNQLKTQRFLEKTPYDFRLFFSNIPGTGRYSEYGPMKPEVLQQVFGKEAQQIIDGSEDAITIVFVGNKGDSKVMMTPWIMAHRFGHAIQAGHRNVGASRSGAWPEAEQYFFNTVNQLLERCYGKVSTDQYGRPARSGMSWNLTPEYNALFNAIGTQRSSRSNEIKRPYEFLYELFAQYLGTGTITLNPLPTNLGYGRQAWGNPTKYLYLKPEFRDEETRQYESQGIADDLSQYFAEVLRSCVGNIYIM